MDNMTNTAKIIPFANPTRELMREGADLKERIDADTARLREINLQLAELAEFPAGKDTAHLEAEGIEVTVARKLTVSWDQPSLNKVRARLGDAVFFALFKWEFKPQSKKKIDGFVEFAKPEERDLVLDAMTTKPAAPSVSYKRVEA